MRGILLDQGLPRSAAKILKREGWDVLNTGNMGLSMASDREILQYARAHERIIITLDSDFHTILAVENAKHPSVIRIRIEGLKGEGLAEIIGRICPKIEMQLETGALVTVTERSIRVRKIPIH